MTLKTQGVKQISVSIIKTIELHKIHKLLPEPISVHILTIVIHCQRFRTMLVHEASQNNT